MEQIVIETKNLIEKLKSCEVPANCSSALGVYASNGLREKYLSLYEAYLLMTEYLHFEKMSYSQPAWSGRVNISTLLKILNMKMLSILFQDDCSTALWTEYGVDAYKRNREVRPHYILDEYLMYLNAEDNPSYLKKLSEIRQKKRKSFNKGPYHDETFPWSECNFEELLLKNERFSDKDKQVSKVVEDHLVELYFIQEQFC